MSSSEDHREPGDGGAMRPTLAVAVFGFMLCVLFGCSQTKTIPPLAPAQEACAVVIEANEVLANLGLPELSPETSNSWVRAQGGLLSRGSLRTLERSGPVTAAGPARVEFLGTGDNGDGTQGVESVLILARPTEIEPSRGVLKLREQWDHLASDWETQTSYITGTGWSPERLWSDDLGVDVYVLDSGNESQMLVLLFANSYRTPIGGEIKAELWKDTSIPLSELRCR